jgi:hypothetical protein
MPHVNYLVTRFVTEDPVQARKLNRIAAELQQQLDVIVLDGESVGLIKEADVEFDLNDPSGHEHRSTPQEACQRCFQWLALDGVHDPDA